jgi:serine/threonine-protein kinase RsbW
MAQGIGGAALSVALDVYGCRPSVSVAGKADHSNISDVVDVLDRLVEEHERCVSLDLGGLESMDMGAAERLIESAGTFKDRNRRLHLSCVSVPVRDVFDRMMVSEAFCVESECAHEHCPGRCGIASKAWEMDVFTLPAVMTSCQEARARVDRVAEAVGFSMCRRKDVMLAVGEAVTNAIEHGSALDPRASFTVSCLATADKLSVSIADNGPGFSPEDLPDPLQALYMERGRGVLCMRAAMDEVSFHFEAGTTVRMVKLGA